MSSQAISAFATILKWNGTEVAELSSISGPAQKGKSIDVTNMDSPNGYAEHIQGIIDGGQIAVEGNWTSVAAQTQALSDFQSKAVHPITITLPSAHTWTATGFWIDLSQDFKVTDKITFKATLQITGEPVYA